MKGSYLQYVGFCVTYPGPPLSFETSGIGELLMRVSSRICAIDEEEFRLISVIGPRPRPTRILDWSQLSGAKDLSFTIFGLSINEAHVWN